MKRYGGKRTSSSSTLATVKDVKRGRYSRFTPSRFTNVRTTRDGYVAPGSKNNTVDFGVGFPKKAKQTLLYSEIVNLVGTTGGNGNYFFSCNGMYDPNVTGTGHQTLYFDQMAAVYNHYTVIGSKITITPVPFTATSESWIMSLCQNDDAAVTTATPTGQAEIAGSKYMIVPANFSGVPLSLSDNWSAKKTFGGSVLGNDNLQGTSGANPTEVTNWLISIRATDSVSTVSCYVKVEIEYIAIWEELKDIAQS